MRPPQPVAAQAPPRTVLLETTAMSRPGGERGLGRYTVACRDACEALGFGLQELRLVERQGRAAEFRDLPARALRARRIDADVFHAPHPGVWGPTPMPTVTSILDVIPLDLGGLYGQTGFKSRFFFSRAARADAVLTLSRYSAERIVDLLGVEEERLVIAPLYPETPFRTAGEGWEPGAERPYVLAMVDLASFDPRKRASWIEPIAKTLKRAGVETRVVGAGTGDAGVPFACVRPLGRLSDEDLAREMAGAACFLYVSAYEGQGMPPLEAMAAGAPVVGMANTAVREVVAGAGVLVEERGGGWSGGLAEDAGSRAAQEELTAACLEIARDPGLRAELSGRSRRQAATFSEQRFRDGLDRAYGIAEARCG